MQKYIKNAIISKLHNFYSMNEIQINKKVSLKHTISTVCLYRFKIFFIKTQIIIKYTICKKSPILLIKRRPVFVAHQLLWLNTFRTSN